MAESTPTQTWNQGELIPISTYNIANYVSALSTALSASTHWQVLDSGSGGLLVGPTSPSSPVADMRYVFGGSDTTAIPVDARFYTATSATAYQGVLFAGVSPDTGRDTFENAWDSALGPFGTDRFSRYMNLMNPSFEYDALWIVECAEMVEVWLRRRTQNNVFGGIIGALVEPGIDAGGDSSGDPRLYGGYTTGVAGLPASSSFWSSTSGVLTTGSSPTNGVNIMFAFEPSSNTTEFLYRRTAYSTAPRSHTTKNQAQYFDEILLSRSSQEAVGKVRQIGASSNALPMDVRNLGGEATAIAVAQDFDAVGPAMWMINNS